MDEGGIGSRPGPRRAGLGIAVGVVALTLAVYVQVLGFDFVRYDDPRYVTENPVVLSGLTRTSVSWAFTTFHKANWHPLAWLSHMLDVELFGVDPAGHHATSLLLHLVNTLLLFSLWRRLTGDLWPSAWVAALFAVHPLHVESVAWVAERKDVLCTFFGFLSLNTYVSWVRGGGRRWWWASLGLFAASLGSKPMLVTLPFVLLLLDAWPLARLHLDRSAVARVVEKLPFLLLAALSSVLTLAAQSHGGATGLLDLELSERLSSAVVAVATYLMRTVWPAGLAVLYPHPYSASGTPLSAAAVAGATVGLAALTGLAAWSRRPYAVVGWLWFLGTLVPVSGIVQVGFQASADRYTYVPLVGVFVALAWAAQDAMHRVRARWVRRAVAAAGVASVVLLAVVAWVQVRVWRDAVTLYEHCVDVAPSSIMHNNFGAALAAEGRIDEAIHHYQEALRIEPDNALAHRNLAHRLRDLGRYRESVHHLLRWKNVDEDSAAGHLAFAAASRAEGDLGAAVAHLRRAIELDPDSADARRQLDEARAALESGRPTAPGVP